MTVRRGTEYLSQQLSTIYNEGEAASIARLVMEHITGVTGTARIARRETLLTPAQTDQLAAAIARLLKHEPVQYVLNESWFCGLKFYVDQNVLIPRPETEELVEWIISNCRFPVSELRIFDIGTGSGCIPVTLKRRIRKAEVWACDTSSGALETAKRNADNLGTDVHFLQLDFLDRDTWKQLPVFDTIVSNPPYVPEKDREQMDQHVLAWEPATALFVPDDNPLIFYESIADFSLAHLDGKGYLYLEIHEDLGSAVIQLLSEKGFQPEIKKDMQQKDRMIRAGLV